MVRVTLSILILFVVGYAFLIAVIVLFLDKYLDLRVVAYAADASRQATNLLHFILTSSCTGAVKDEEKLVLDLSELNQFSDETKWEGWEGCSNLEYDYNFSVATIDPQAPNEFSGTIVPKLVFNYDDPCYMSYQRIRGYVEMPVVLCNEWKGGKGPCVAGIANLTLMKTPLSELAFWVSQASLRIKERYDEEVIKSIRVGPEVSRIEIDRNNFCMLVNGTRRCKQFFIESGIEFKVYRPEKVMEKEMGGIKVLDPGFECYEEVSLARNLPRKCKIINIYANATDRKVKMILPVIT